MKKYLTLKTCLVALTFALIFTPQLSLGTEEPKAETQNKGNEKTEETISSDISNPKDPWTTYFVGDLSYALEDRWEEILQNLEKHKLKNNNQDNFYTIELLSNNGEKFNIFLFTVDGDGVYTSTKNEKIGVDSGTIGAVPIDFWGERYPEEVDSLGIVRQLDPKNIKLSGRTVIIDDIIFKDACP